MDAGFARIRFVSALTSSRGLGILAALLVLMPALGALGLAATHHAWLPQLEALGTGAMLPYALASILLVGAGLTPTHAHSLVAGLLFGALAGSCLALAIVSIAAQLAHGILGKWSRPLANLAFARRPRVGAVRAALVTGSARRLVSLIALVRLSPIMPFAGTNLLLAATGVPWVPFGLGSVLGLAPRVVAVAVAGAGLRELDLRRSTDVRLAILGGLATVLTLLLIGRVARRVLQERETSRAERPESF